MKPRVFKATGVWLNVDDDRCELHAHNDNGTQVVVKFRPDTDDLQCAITNLMAMHKRIAQRTISRLRYNVRSMSTELDGNREAVQ